MNDVWSVILSYINCGSDYKSCVIVSKQWYSWMQTLFPSADIAFANHLITLLKLFPDKPWCNRELSRNPNINWEYAEAHPEIVWDRTRLLANPSAGMDIISAYRNEYNPAIADRNTNLTWKFICSFPVDSWDWIEVSCHPCVTWDIITQNPNKPWDWDGISENPNITWQIVRDNTDYPWNWRGLTRNSQMTPDIIRANPDKPWKWSNLAQNPSATWDLLQEHIDELSLDIISLSELSAHPSITWEIVQASPQIRWNHNLIKNSNITWEIVTTHLTQFMTHNSIDYNPYLTWKIIRDNPQIGWDWYDLSCHKFNYCKK